MKILITNYHPYGGGGHTTYIKSLVSTAQPDCKFYVACPSSSLLFSSLCDTDIQTHDVEFPGKLREIVNIVVQAKRLKRLIVQHQYDVIHVNGSPDHRLVMLVLLTLPKKMQPRIVFTKHNSFALKDSILTRLRFRYFCSAIILVCKGLEKTIPNKMSRQTFVTIIENGVDTSFFQPVNANVKSVLRDRYRIPSHALVLVSCAGTARHKGWHFLVNALSGKENFFVLLVGDRPSDDDLTEMIGSTKKSNLQFTGYQEDVRPFLQMGDIGFVLSTSIETASFACREMMAVGLPVVVSDIGGLPYTVDEKTGWVVAAGSSSDITQVITSFTTANLELMSTDARKRVVDMFTIDSFKRKTIDVYGRVLQDERGS